MSVTIQGYGGQVDSGAFKCKAGAWSLDFITDTVNNTGYADAGYMAGAMSGARMDGRFSGVALNASATIQDTLGAVVCSTDWLAKLNQWSLDIDFGVQDNSGFGDLGWHTAVPTLCRASGSGSGWLTHDLPVPAAVIASPVGVSDAPTITLTATTGCTYAMTAVVTRRTLGRAFNAQSLSPVSLEWLSSGRITQTWAGSDLPVPATTLVTTLVPGDAIISATFTAASGCTYAGSFAIKRVRITRPYGGICTLDYEVTSNGVITQTWA